MILMALETMLNAIQREANEKVQRIDQDTVERAQAIHERAKARVEAEVDRYVEEARVEATRELQREVNAANLKSTRAQTDVRREVYDEVFAAVRTKLEEMRASATYPDVFRALVCDAITGLGAGLEVHIDPRDTEHLDAFLASGVSTQIVKVVPDLSSLGGVIAYSENGRVMRDNTLEARLERVRVERARDIWDVLEP